MPIIELDENSQKVLQPKNIKIPLKEHQLTSIHAMAKLEYGGLIKKKATAYICRGRIYHVGPTPPQYYLYRDNKTKNLNVTIKTNFGILADVVGSGKTYIIMGLISSAIVPPEHDRILPSSTFCAMQYNDGIKSHNTNCVIVPHNLITQWKQAFSYSTLKVFTVARHSDIDILKYSETKTNTTNTDTDANTDDQNICQVNQYDVLLCSANMLADYMNAFPNIKYARMIIDEVCSIKLPPDLNWDANFIWFITATPSGISKINRNYIRYIVSGIHSFVFDNIIIKNNDEYVSRSMSLPRLNQILIKCFTPKQLQLIREYVPADVIDMLNAGNMPGAITHLNCNVDTDEGILEVITKKIAEDIHNKMAELRYQEQRIVTDKIAHDEHLDKLRQKLQSVQNKYDSITARIKQFKEDTCPICLEDFTNVQASVLTCCNQLLCVTCLASIPSKGITAGADPLLTKICPMCRTQFDMSQIHVIADKSHAKNVKEDIVITKEDAVIKIIKGKVSGKFLLFSNHDQTFTNLLNKFSENNIKHSRVMGTIYTINNTLKKFADGEIQVLMLNAKDYGSGLNLQMATDVIIYHELSRELETQVIGRAQRLGRENPLNVYYLLFEHEKHNVDNPVLSLDLNLKSDETAFNKHLGVDNQHDIDDDIPSEIFELEEELPPPPPVKKRAPRKKAVVAPVSATDTTVAIDAPVAVTKRRRTKAAPNVITI
jgi:SNF2 family DNA or RNA helicase